MNNVYADKLIKNINKVIIGKEKTVENIVIAMLVGGHVLIEDVPGVGKTKLVSALSKSINGEYNRIQLTPDIMPSDITGFSMINSETKDFEFRKGSIFCNFLLADEINRASPKSQSALLEAMEEHQISIDGNTYVLENPFMVLATQNPVETYGTYHLPEAQMDRFLMRVSMGYPSENEEVTILNNVEKGKNSNSILESVITTDDVIMMQNEVKTVFTDEKIKKYIVDICTATRKNDDITLGASPRGSIALFKASKAYAYLKGREYVIPEDVKAILLPVISHRIILSPKGKTRYKTQENAVSHIANEVKVPVMG